MTRIRSWHWGMAMFGVGIVFGGWLVSQEDPVSSATSELRRTFGLPPAHAQGSQKAAPKLSPVKARPRDIYFPNSEDLAEDEMRVIACGTGMPTTRAAQAAACF